MESGLPILFRYALDESSDSIQVNPYNFTTNY